MDGKPRVAFVDDDPRLRSLIAEESVSYTHLTLPTKVEV